MSIFTRSIDATKANIEQSKAVKPGLLERIGQKLSSEKAEVESIKANLAEKEASAQAIAQKFNSLVEAVNRETNNLNQARIQFQGLQNELRSLEAVMLDGWANNLPPGYQRIVSLRAALEDFPRVEKHLQQRVGTAQMNLEAFEKAHA